MSEENTPKAQVSTIDKMSLVLVVLWLAIGFGSAGSKIYRDVQKHGIGVLVSMR